MSKKKRKSKKAKKHPPKADLMEQGHSTIDVRSDLRKTAILTAVCLGILFLLYLSNFGRY